MGLGVVSVLGHGILFVRLCDVCIGLNHVCDELLGKRLLVRFRLLEGAGYLVSG